MFFEKHQLSQPLLGALDYLNCFSILVRATSTIPSHSTYVNGKPLDIYAHSWVTYLPILTFGTLPLISSQWLDVNFHP